MTTKVQKNRIDIDGSSWSIDRSGGSDIDIEGSTWSIEVPVGAGAVSLSESFKHEKVNNNVAVNKAIYLIMDLYYLICKCRAIPTLA